jgi:hypothetical protein
MLSDVQRKCDVFHLNETKAEHPKQQCLTLHVADLRSAIPLLRSEFLYVLNILIHAANFLIRFMKLRPGE